VNEFKVGLLAIATIASVIIMSLKVTSNQSGFGDYVTYRTIIRDASGIFPKTPIKVAGINAGRIKKIELADNNAVITFEVLQKVTITKDSQLTIKSVGFLGDKYIEIKIGDSTQRLEPNGFISSKEGGGMENLVQDASVILKDVKDVVRSLKESLAPDNEEPPIKVILSDVKELLNNTKVATASLKRMMVGNEEKINSMIANLEQFSKDVAYQVNNQNKDSAMSDVKTILANAKKITNDLEGIIANVKAGRGTVGKLLVEEQIADEVQQTLSGVNRLVNRFNNIRSELEVFTGGNTNYGSESTLALRLYPAPERFYQFGVVTSEYGPESETIIRRNVDGTESVEYRNEQTKDTFRFNFQLGRQVHNWVFRGGLIETSGGLGLDYQLRDWGSKFSLDVFDYRESLGPNVRFSTEQQLYNVLYGRIRIEDMLQEDTRSATISLGLKFTDEDLRALLGFFL
jgi:phospholipid/cholesterol/gamma-HCH transport system substrate-binding protein